MYKKKISIFTYTYRSMYTLKKYTCVIMCVYTYIYIYEYTGVYIYIYMTIRVYIYIYDICICIYDIYYVDIPNSWQI